MSRRSTSDPDPDDDPDPEDEDDDEDADRPPRRRPRPPGRARNRPRSSRGPVRRWKSAGGEDEADSGGRPPVFWRARDSLYFEPLVALAIIIVLIVGMYAYTQNWPPVYVVESKSMQHGTNDVLGVINTGDLVLAQKIANGSIQPYVVGLKTGYSTYGEYGDVLLYQPNGQSGTPVIHRAILFLDWDPAGGGSYSAPGLAGLACGDEANAVYNTTGGSSPCSFSNLAVGGSIDLYRIGWSSIDVSISLSVAQLGGHSGYLTMGDNNFVPNPCTTGCQGITDPEQGISQLVEPGWIIGVARGMIPWVGAIKLALEGQASMVPAQSWQFLGLTVAGLILLALGIHFALRAEGVEDPRRKAEEEEEAEERDRHRAEAEDEDEEEDDRPDRPHRFLSALRPWRPDEDPEGGAPAARATSTGPKNARSPGGTGRRGRPRPRVKRAEKPKRRRIDDDDDL